MRDKNETYQCMKNKIIIAESCKALISQAFSIGVHRIYAECDPDNSSSWKLLETLGFHREAHFRKNVYFWKSGAGKIPMYMPN